jgi:hypothetical protein
LEEVEDDVRRRGNDVQIMNAKPDERMTSFFAQPGILAGQLNFLFFFPFFFFNTVI